MASSKVVSKIQGATTVGRLTKKISLLTISDPTRILRMTNSDSNSNSASGLESHPSSLYDDLNPFPFGLHDTAASYQALLHPSSLYDGPSHFPFGLHDTTASYQALVHLSSLYTGPSPFPFGLRNMVVSYQAQLQDSVSPV
jgi:hypothetical protein